MGRKCRSLIDDELSISYTPGNTFLKSDEKEFRKSGIDDEPSERPEYL